VDLVKYIRRLDRDYGELTVVRSAEELGPTLENFYTVLAMELSSNNFVSTQSCLHRAQVKLGAS
jgi:hypothetical protein